LSVNILTDQSTSYFTWCLKLNHLKRTVEQLSELSRLRNRPSKCSNWKLPI